MTSAAATEWNLHRFEGRADAGLLNALGQLAHAAQEADGNPPFNDQTWISLRSAQDREALSGVVAVLTAGPEHDDDEVVGAAIITRSPGAADVLELVVRPEDRGHGIGSELAQAVLASGGDGVHAWSHGDSQAAAALAQAHGFAPVRELWRMRSPLKTVPEAGLPQDVSVRTFVPGQDEAAWLALNSRAFASHAEQGAMTIDDLREREREPWFDPNGFFLAEGEHGELLGFHWTKVHPSHTDAQGQEHPAMGEIYVVGISPAAQGRGLGKALTLLGLNHLREQGLQSAMLYVDADNVAAVKLYRSLGFERWDADVMYAKSAPHSY